jgi:hypothetical protein
MGSIRRATKRQQKARLFFYGLSGSGKTTTAIEIATLLAPSSDKVVVIDTENENSSGALDLFPDFNVLPVDAPFSMDSLVKAFKEAEAFVGEGGVIIIDTISKYWEGLGGALDEVNKITNGNKAKTQDAWGTVTPKIAKARETITSSKTAHVIVTSRVKSDTIMEEYIDKTGKTRTKAVKVGLAPVFKADIEYEFHIALEFSLLTDKQGRDAQVIRNTKPPRINYFRDKQFVIPPYEADEIEQWNAKRAVAEIKYYLDQGVEVKLLDLFNKKLAEYKDVTGKDHPFVTTDFTNITEDDIRTKGKILVTDIEQAKKKLEPIPS